MSEWIDRVLNTPLDIEKCSVVLKLKLGAEAYLEHSPKSKMGFVCKNSEQFLAVKYFRQKASS